MICPIVRILISSAADSGNPLPRFAEKHAEACPACREFMVFTGLLGRRLADDSCKPGTRPPATIENELRRPVLAPAPVFIAAAACALVCVVLVANLAGPRAKPPAGNAAPPAVSASGLTALLDALPEELDPMSPLDDELAAAGEDAMSAARFVAASVLPL